MLNKEQFRILRQKGTEAPGSGEYNKFYPEEGVFACAGCSTPLYKVGTKFDSGCGCVLFPQVLSCWNRIECLETSY